jgi:hypothetical protein
MIYKSKSPNLNTLESASKFRLRSKLKPSVLRLNFIISRESQNLRYTKPMTLVLPKHLEKRLEAIATERHVQVDTLVAQALEAFLAQPQRRNSKGFIVPSFVGSVASEDSSWIDQHEELFSSV